MSEENIKYLNDVLKAIARIDEYIGSPKKLDKYISNFMLKHAVERNLEIIGEALNKVIKSESSLTISNSRKIIDTRNRIIHGYDEVEDIIVWSIIIKHLPILKVEIKDILAKK